MTLPETIPNFTATPKDDNEWWELSEAVKAATTPSFGAYYNNNYVFDLTGQRLVLRVPKTDIARIDPVILNGNAVQAQVARHGIKTPAILYSCMYFAVMHYVPAPNMGQVCAPPALPPQKHLQDVLQLVRDLQRVPLHEEWRLPPLWPQSGDSAGYALELIKTIEAVYKKYAPRRGTAFAMLGLPAKPMEALRAAAAQLAPRRFQILHGDLRRENVLWLNDESVFIDWDFASYGDPLADIATYISRARLPLSCLPELYELAKPILTPDQQRDFLHDVELWTRVFSAGSVINDVVRYPAIAQNPKSKRRPLELVANMMEKITNAAPLWGLTPPDFMDLRDWLMEWPAD